MMTRELWGDGAGAAQDDDGLGIFLSRLAQCYDALGQYNDYDLDIDL